MRLPARNVHSVTVYLFLETGLCFVTLDYTQTYTFPAASEPMQTAREETETTFKIIFLTECKLFE